MPAYGLIDSGWLCYLTSFEALKQEIGLCRSRFEPSLYFSNQNKEQIILVAQVANFLYVGTLTISKQLEAFLQDQLKWAPWNHLHLRLWTLIYTKIREERSLLGHALNLKKLNQSNKIHRSARKGISQDRRMSSPGTVQLLASFSASVDWSIQLHSTMHSIRLRSVGISTRGTPKCSTPIKNLKKWFGLHQVCDSKWAPFSFGSDVGRFTERNRSKDDVRGEFILFRRSANTIHAISWTSRLPRRVSRSKSTAELLAAAEAVDKVTYLKHLLVEFTTS